MAAGDASGSSNPTTVTMNADRSVTANFTASAADLIFKDGFESGDFSAWSSSTIDGGDLSVTSAAALFGAFGMQANINDNTPIFVTDTSPNAESRYRARFYFDPNSIPMANGDAHIIFNGYSGTSTSMLWVELIYSSTTGYRLRVRLLDDSTNWKVSSIYNISDAVHFLELDWQAASAAGANDGYLTFWIDGVQMTNLTGVDNDTRRIDWVRLGATYGLDSGTRGTYFFDAFESRRSSNIGAEGTQGASIEIYHKNKR